MRRKEPKLGDLDHMGPGNSPRKPQAGRARAPAHGAAAAARRGAPVVAAIESPPPAAPARAKPKGPEYQSAHLLGARGRARRIAFINIVAFALLMIGGALGVASAYVDAPRDGLFIAKACGFAVIVVASVWLLLTAGVRRLHDLNRSGFWMLTILIPAVNALLLLVLVIWPGKEKSNNFGAPAPRYGLLTWLAFFLVVLMPIGLLPAGWIWYDTQLNT